MRAMRILRRMYIWSFKIKAVHIVSCLLMLGLLDYFGAFVHLFEIDFYKSFSYPLEGDITRYVEQLKNHEELDVQPINVYNYSFISSSHKKCNAGGSERLRLVYIVKSAAKHFDRRLAIRNSWGYERRFSDVPIITVFVLGIVLNDLRLQMDIENEHKKYGDIVQAEFIDTYFNNTVKTMMGFKWAVTFCSNSKFYMFADDDMYISTKNVLRFVRNPTHYPEYLETPVYALKQKNKRSIVTDKSVNTSEFINSVSVKRNERKLQQIMDFELSDDVRLYSGYVFVSAPHRHRSSKWHITLSEYPYHMWPPYVSAGAYILSHDSLIDMYYGSFYTKHFRFDDIYLGLIAKKMDIEPYHCREFYFYKKEYNKYNYRYVIASHGYENPNELLHIWNEQRSSGRA